MVNYANGKIYKIEPIVEHEEGDIYIGSTTKQYLSQRMDLHRRGYKSWKKEKRNKVMSFELFDKYGMDSCQIVLIEAINANSKDELHSREALHIKTLKCVNKTIPQRTMKEYYADNLDKITTYKHDYYDKHKEKYLERRKQYYEENKEDLAKQMKTYQQTNIDKIRLRCSTIVVCECGSEITHYKKARHMKTIKHIEYINKNNLLQ
jgi:hypothetical protein